MDVLVLSKTHMNHGKCCVGGMTMDGRYVRLLTSGGDNQPDTTSLAPRQVWEIEFTDRADIEPPHIEDVIVVKKKQKGTLKDDVTILEFIKQRKSVIWRGSPVNLFDQKLKWTHNGSGYIAEDSIPKNSVGFWIPNKSLSKSIYYEKVRYSYKDDGGWKSLPYIGFDETLEVIPSGSLLRVSLARWWDTNGKTELRCALQLSGWYDI